MIIKKIAKFVSKGYDRKPKTLIDNIRWIYYTDVLKGLQIYDRGEWKDIPSGGLKRKGE